jgi:hypothetical protein
MFYSLPEAALKLKKTEEEVKQLAKKGKLREFRDGPHILFKTDEVDALAGDTVSMPAEEAAEPKSAEPETPELELAETGMPEVGEEIATPELETPGIEAPEIEMPEMEIPETETHEPSAPAADTVEEILLAPETGAPGPPAELTDADTALTGEGIRVLGETDRDYQVTEDTMAETVASTGTGGTTPEPSLEEIEGDVSMDTFGSGSGLLDLSLQADDTSLGAILDEIYSGEGVEGPPKAGPAKGAPAKAPVKEAAAEVDLTAGEIPEEELVGPVALAGADIAAIAPAYVELEPDVVSNTLGKLLFLPLLLLVYAAAAAVGGLRGVVPSIVAKVQGLIWYIMIGAVVLTGAVVAAAFMLSGDIAIGTKKEKKPKETKKPKPSKKAKKGKEVPPEPEETAV